MAVHAWDEEPRLPDWGQTRDFATEMRTSLMLLWRSILPFPTPHTKAWSPLAPAGWWQAGQVKSSLYTLSPSWYFMMTENWSDLMWRSLQGTTLRYYLDLGVVRAAMRAVSLGESLKESWSCLSLAWSIFWERVLWFVPANRSASVITSPAASDRDERRVGVIRRRAMTSVLSCSASDP